MTYRRKGRNRVGASLPTSLRISRCQVIGSRFYFVFFHVSEFKNQWWEGNKGRGQRRRQGRRHVGPFFAGLAAPDEGSCAIPAKGLWSVHRKARRRRRRAENNERGPARIISLYREGEKEGKTVCRRDGCLDWGRTRLEGRSEDEDKGGRGVGQHPPAILVKSIYLRSSATCISG